jgi:hypothetical protein
MIKTDRQILLTAVRKGEFRALLALADHLEESDDPDDKEAHRRWRECVHICRYSVRRHLTGRSRRGGIEWVTRNLYWCLRRMSPYLGMKWHKSPDSRQSAPWQMAAKMADGMYARTLQIIRSEDVQDERGE